MPEVLVLSKHKDLMVSDDILILTDVSCDVFEIDINTNGICYISYNKKNSICFSEIELEDDSIMKIKDIKHLIFHDCTIGKFTCDHNIGLRALNLVCNSIKYADDLQIDKSIYIEGVIKEINFNSTIFSESVDLQLSNKDNACRINFKDSHFGKKLKIRNIENGETYEYYQNNKAVVKELSIIDCTCDKGAYIRIGFLAVEKFKLSNLRNPENSELNIGDCHFKNFQLSNFRNMGKFKLYNINILENEHKKNSNNETFQIDNTSIGVTDFQSIYLTSFNKVVMFDNIFANILYSNVKWTKDIEVDKYGKNETTKIEKKRDSYRTLKNVALANRDHQEALSFYAKEMGEHKKIIDKNNKWFSIDRVILSFNYYTNNFGLDWWKPIEWLLWISLLFYTTFSFIINDNFYLGFDIGKYLLSYSYLINYLQDIEVTSKNIWLYTLFLVFRVIEILLLYRIIIAIFRLVEWTPIKFLLWIPLFLYVVLSCMIYDSFYLDFNIRESFLNYFYLINPLQNIEAVSKKNEVVYILVLFFRMIEALLLYQTVQAFRKYTRKI